MFLLSISEDILLYFSGFGMLQAILLAAILYFHPKSDRSVNRFLALYILSLGLPISLPLAQHIFSWQTIIFIEPFLALIAPFLYLYIRSFKEVITWHKAWPHFILFIICIPVAWWVYSEVGSHYPAAERPPSEAARQFILLVPHSIRIVQRIIYFFFSKKELTIYQRSIRHLFSDISRINLDWVSWLLNGFLFLIFLSIIISLLILRYPVYIDWWVLIGGVIVALYIFLAAFRGITQVTLWQIHPEINKENLEDEIMQSAQLSRLGTSEEKTNSQRVRMADSRISEITHKISELMERGKIYQETELTLQDLADKIQSPSYQVSQAINEGMKKSFYDLVNGYRVEEAKRLLLDPKNQNFTILSVGFEAGFNSKTTFNTVFKKFTGLTPSEFRDKQMEPSVPV